MREVNLPDGFPRLAVLLRMKDKWYCSLCGALAVTPGSIVHDTPSCGAMFVAVASSLGRSDQSLRAIDRFPKLAIAPQLQTPPVDRWINPEEAEMVVRDARLRKHPFDNYFTAGRANAVIRRLFYFARDEVEHYGRPEPFRTDQLKDDMQQVELRSAVRFFARTERKIPRVGLKAQQNVAKLLGYLDQQYTSDSEQQ